MKMPVRAHLTTSPPLGGHSVGGVVRCSAARCGARTFPKRFFSPHCSHPPAPALRKSRLVNEPSGSPAATTLGSSASDARRKPPPPPHRGSTYSPPEQVPPPHRE